MFIFFTSIGELFSLNLHSRTYDRVTGNLLSLILLSFAVPYLLSEQKFSLCIFVIYSKQGTEPVECIILWWFRLNKLTAHRNGAHDLFK